jgi:HAMP domain-containing protein
MRFGLSTKIFLSFAAVVTSVLAVTLYVTSTTSRANAERAIQAGLTVTNQRIEEQLQGRQKELQRGLTVFATNSVVVTTIFGDTSGADARDQASQAAEQAHAKWVQVIDADGVRMAKSDDAAAPRSRIASALVDSALAGTSAAGFGVMGDSTVIQVVTVPMLRDQNNTVGVVGVLMAAIPVTDSLAASIGKSTGSEVAFYVVDSTGRIPHVAGATIPAEQRASLQQEVAERVLRRGEQVELAGKSLADARATPASMMGATTERSSISIGGKEYVGQGTPLLSASGRPIGGFVSMRSLDDELAGYYGLRRTLLLTGAIALVLAFLISGAVTRQIVRPVTALVGAARRAADGDYNAEIPAHGNDEIGTLAEAVRRLLRDLRDKQALVDFLGGNREMAGPTLVRDLDATMPLASARTLRLDRGELVPGKTLGVRYDIQAMLGEGGMGMVYRAVDRELQEVVAIKTLRPEMIASDGTALERFKSEIKLARKISHRNVVRTHDFGESEGLYFITMEFVEGTSLKELIRQRRRLPASVLLPIAKQLCRALEVAHDAGVIHRDIKPQNMVVENDGTLKVMDFGIARLATRAPQQGLTEAGTVIGTPEYMAPEQLLGDELDARADIYATGVVLYECLTGKLPFEAPSAIVLISRVLEETPPAPHTLYSDIPESMSKLVMRAMARDRDARPASAKALHDTLEQLG